MVNQIRVMKQALEALEVSRPIEQHSAVPHNKHVVAITTLRQAIQEQEQAQPVDVGMLDSEGGYEFLILPTPPYTAPPRQPLTDVLKQRIHDETGASHSLICLVEKYIGEAAHGIKEKNT